MPVKVNRQPRLQYFVEGSAVYFYSNKDEIILMNQLVALYDSDGNQQVGAWSLELGAWSLVITIRAAEPFYHPVSPITNIIINELYFNTKKKDGMSWCLPQHTMF